MAAASNPIALRYWNQCQAISSLSVPEVEVVPPTPDSGIVTDDKFPPWVTPPCLGVSDRPAPAAACVPDREPAPVQVPNIIRRIGAPASDLARNYARTDWAAILAEEDAGMNMPRSKMLTRFPKPWRQQKMKQDTPENCGEEKAEVDFHQLNIGKAQQNINQTTHCSFKEQNVKPVSEENEHQYKIRHSKDDFTKTIIPSKTNGIGQPDPSSEGVHGISCLQNVPPGVKQDFVLSQLKYLPTLEVAKALAPKVRQSS